MTKKNQNLKSGSQLGPYKITRLLGTGGMGEVYEAHDESLNRHVALKTISSHLLGVDGFVKRFLSEGQALARMNHPNVVTVYALSQENGRHFIAMEYIDGRSLDEIIGKSGIPYVEAIKYFKQILKGTIALHESGIIHRDLKPKNIIVGKDNNLKIVDFGIAKMNEDEKTELEVKTEPGVLVGSTHHLAPEIIGGAEPTESSDIWSLGIILYQMLFAKRPFIDTPVATAIDNIVNSPMEFPHDFSPDIPSGILEIILKMCEKSTDYRYVHCVDILRDIRALERDRAMQADSGFFSSKKFGYMIATTFCLLIVAMIFVWRNKSSSHRLKAENAPVETNDRYQEIAKPVAVAPVSQPAAPVAQAHYQAPVQASPPQPQASSNDAASVLSFESPSPIKHRHRPAAEAEAAAPVVEAHIEREVANETPQPTLRASHKVIPHKAPPTLSLSNGNVNLTLHYRSSVQFRNPASVQKNLVEAPKLNWPKSTGASGYEVQISKDANFASTEWTTTSKTNNAVWPVAIPGTFYYRVRPLGLKGDKANFSNAKKIVLAVPAVQPNESLVTRTISSENADPASGTISVPVSWPPVAGASGYRVIVSRQKNLLSPFSVIKSQSTTTILDLDAGTYYVGIAPTDELNQMIADYSAPIKVNVEKAKIAPLETPKVHSPINGISIVAMGSQSPIVFAWDAVPKAENYRIELATDKSFAKPFFKKTLSDTQIIYDKSLPVGKVFWRVMAEQGERKSSWTSDLYFEISN